MGYWQAGFAVVGVDIRPQPRFPFCFIQADALEFLKSVKPGDYALIAASPPCQAYSVCKASLGNRRWGMSRAAPEYPDLVPAVREALLRCGVPYVIENVVGAPVLDPVLLCGLMFDLRVFRHRLFESSEFLLRLPHPNHGERRIGFDGYCCVVGNGDSGRGTRVDRHHRRKATWEEAMGIDWMTKREMTQAIPPSYTEWLGFQIRQQL